MKLNERAMRIIRLLLPILLGVMLTVCAVLFITSACAINKLGQSPYTYQTIGAAFRKIALPVYITLGLAVITGIVMTFFAPDGARRGAPPRDSLSRLKLLTRTRDLASADAEAHAKFKKEEKLRATLYYVNVVLFALGIVTAVIIIALCTAAMIQTGIGFNELLLTVLRVSFIAFNSLIPAIILAFARIPLDALSAEREIAVLQELPRIRPKQPEAREGGFPTLLAVRISVLVLATVFIVVGIFNGGMSDVVQKAIKICTECIGLG